MEIQAKFFDELTAPELFEILRLRAETFVVGQACAYQDPDETDLASLHVWLEEDGKMLAYLRAFPKAGTPDTVQIGRVLSVTHGLGHGAAVMRAGMAAIAARMPCSTLFLESQTYAIGFYEKLGFRVVSDEFLDVGIPHKNMVRAL